MTIRNVSLSIIVTSALVTTGYLFLNPIVRAKDVPQVSPQQEKIYYQQKVRDQEERHAKLKPIVNEAIKGDYAQAYRRFNALEAEGSGSFLKQKVMCLLNSGDPQEGLAQLKAAKKGELSSEAGARLHVALAVRARDNDELASGLDEWKRANAFSETRNSNGFDSHLLMTVAISFGRNYDREMMHLLAGEALRRGSRDLDDLLDYAHCCRINGDLRKSVELFEKVQRETRDAKLKEQVANTIYDTKNIIYQFTRDHSIEEEEAARQKECRERFWSRRWY